MKDYKNIIAALNHCGNDISCADCPYYAMADCDSRLMKDAARLIEELEDRLEQATTACNCEAIAQSHSDELYRLNAEYERARADLYEAEQELKYLRAIKATTEAFLGVKIDGQM